MPSFQITIAPHKRAAARFIAGVRRELQKAFSEEKAKRGLNQSEIGRMLGVHRTVIHRELRGDSDLTLGRVAELACVLGRVPKFSLDGIAEADGQNISQTSFQTVESSTTEWTTVLSGDGGYFVPLMTEAV